MRQAPSLTEPIALQRHEASRKAAEIQPRCSRDTAEMQPIALQRHEASRKAAEARVATELKG